MPGIVSSLYTRVLEWVGPRQMPTGTGFQAGYERQLSIPQISQTRWILEDIEGAIAAADVGNLRLAARLHKALTRDGDIHGVGSTRTLGLVQLPVRFRGDDEMVDALAEDFREVFPSDQLALLMWDYISMRLAVGEFIEVEGAKPVLRRIDPEWLWYRWSEDRYYYQSTHGMIPINPGDGRWVLFGAGSVQPINNGLLWALARAYVSKEHAYFYRENYNSKLANAARVGTVPQGASIEQEQSWFEKIAAWGASNTFVTKPGYTVDILEGKGTGFETYTDTINSCNEEIKICIAGQSVTTDGGTGFTNASIFENIRSDLIQGDAEALATFLNIQGLPVWADWKFGAQASDRKIECAWDVTPPKDLNAQATAMNGMAVAAKALNEVLATTGKEVDMDEMVKRFGVAVRDRVASAIQPAAPDPTQPQAKAWKRTINADRTPYVLRAIAA